MRTFNINPFPVDAKKTIREPKVAMQEQSNPKSFKSILESVQTQKMDQPKSTEVDYTRKSNTVAKAPESKAPEETASQNEETVAEEKVDGRPSAKDEKISKKSSEKKSTAEKDLPEESTELASITVELDVEDMVQDQNALAQSLALAVENVPAEENIEPPVDNVAMEISALSTEDLPAEDAFGIQILESDQKNETVLADFDSLDNPVDMENVSLLASENPSVSSSVETKVPEQIAVDENVVALDSTVVASEQQTNVVANVDSESKDVAEPKTKTQGVFTVTDLRTADETSAKIASVDDSSESSSMDMNLNSGNVMANNQGTVQNQSPMQTSENTSFQQMLSQQIQNGSQELVKAGSIVLRDNNSGSINMVLKPESLGNVKVSLELSDKILSGQIVVQSKEAFEAFRQNMDTLKQAFQQNGFESANLSLVLADNGSSNGTFGQGQQGTGEQYMANKTYSDYTQGEVAVDSASTVDSYTKGGSHQIDVVA